jgi:hypothetical protein
MRGNLVKLSNRAKYIQGNLEGTIDLRRKTAQVVDELLIGLGFQKIDGDFKYLVEMPMNSVTEEKVAKIMREKGELENDIRVLEATSVEEIWCKELEALRVTYLSYKTKREGLQNVSLQQAKKMVEKKKKTSSISVGGGVKKT